MKIRHLLFFVSTAAMTALAWGQSEPVIGKKSKVTLSLTIQQTVGAFLVTDAQVARDEAKGIFPAKPRCFRSPFITWFKLVAMRRLLGPWQFRC